MPFCPECRYEYVAGIEKCPDCDIELVDVLPVEEEEAEVINHEEWVRVYTADSEIEAEVLKASLESEGIGVWDQTQVAHSYNTIPLGPEELLVLSSRADEAREIIRVAIEKQTGEDVPE